MSSVHGFRSILDDRIDTASGPMNEGLPDMRGALMRRRAVVLIGATGLHALVVIAFGALSSRHAESDTAGSVVAGYAYSVMGHIAQILVCPLLWMPSDVSEPRTSILFVLNSLLWGGAVLGLYVMRTRRRTGNSDGVLKTGANPDGGIEVAPSCSASASNGKTAR
jgi:hypothetical protein